MELVTIVIVLGICLVVGYLLVGGSGSSNTIGNEATVKTAKLGNAHVSIDSPGGFDHLVVKELKYAAIGANMRAKNYVDKKFILDNEPTESELNELISLNPGMECLILVDIHCSGVNYADCCIRWGLYASAKEYVGNPITPGFEFSGKVVKVIGKQSNKSLNTFKPGDQVFGVSLFGAYSTQILVPNTQLFHKPSNISMAEAAGMLCTLFTAYYALFVLAMPNLLPHIQDCADSKTLKFFGKDNKEDNLNNGETKQELLKRPIRCVLIHSASGGVGSMLVQLCKKIANIDIVVGVVGGQHKIKTAKELGCDFVINRKSSSLNGGNIWDEIESQLDLKNRYNGFDAVFDANGIATLRKSYEFLKPTGKVITYGFHTMLPHSGVISPLQWLSLGYNSIMTPTFNPMKLVSENKGILGFNLSFLFKRTDILQDVMANVMPWIINKDIVVAEITTYRLQAVGKAHRDLQSGNTVGKLVLITENSQSGTLAYVCDADE